MDDVLATRHGPARHFGVGEVPFHQLHIRPGRHVLATAAREIVHDANPIAARQQALDHMGPDESGAAGDKKVSHCSICLLFYLDLFGY